MAQRYHYHGPTIRARQNFRRQTRKLIIMAMKKKSLKICGKWSQLAKKMLHTKVNKADRLLPMERWKLVLAKIMVKVRK